MSNKDSNDYVSTRQTRQSPRALINQQSAYASNKAKCYICGRIGHFRGNCPYQYDTYQHQNTWHYSKTTMEHRVDRSMALQCKVSRPIIRRNSYYEHL